MSLRIPLAALTVLLLPGVALAAGHDRLNLPAWSVTPFVLLLLTIAILPLVAGHWWHDDWNKLLVVTALAVPVIAFLAYVQFATGQHALSALAVEIGKYISFILLLGSLYVVSGGIVLHGDLAPSPAVNTAMLAAGACLANLIGTTGASVLLIRPFLRINQRRQHSRHLPVFFIFGVGNLGGLLTPLGDPPLFMGYLHGVPFSWTLSLWPEWLISNLAVLVIFFIWEMLAFRREALGSTTVSAGKREPLRLEGLINVLFLAGVMGAVLFSSSFPGPWDQFGGEVLMLVMGLLSLWLTPRQLRQANGFTWVPITEVAILFAGIFVTMVPALELLSAHGQGLGLIRSAGFFWLTGLFSSALDNAPTYVAFATMAAGSDDFRVLVRDEVAGFDGPMILRAISCGAVLMGALTYIGNGPNFMVKAIAQEAGYRTPSFFHYMAYSGAILLPVFVLITLIFFRT